MASLEEVRATKERLLRELREVEVEEQQITAEFNYETRPAEVRKYLEEKYSGSPYYFEWVDETHFRVTDYIHRNADEFEEWETGPDNEPLFSTEFHSAWHYALYETRLDLLVDITTGDYEILAVGGVPLAPYA